MTQKQALMLRSLVVEESAIVAEYLEDFDLDLNDLIDSLNVLCGDCPSAPAFDDLFDDDYPEDFEEDVYDEW